MVVIEKIDPVHCRINDRKTVAECLGYDYTFFKKVAVKDKDGNKVKGKFRQKEIVAARDFLATPKASKEQLMYIGHVPKLITWLDEMGIPWRVDEVYGKNDKLLNTKIVKPELPGVKFRSDQQIALQQMIAAGSGVVKAPPGSGKTLLMAGLISAYCNDTVLIVVNTKDIFDQTIKVMERFFPGEVGCFGDGRKDIKDITVALIQTLHRDLPKDRSNWDFGNWWSLLLQDEAHHCRKHGGSYHRVLERVYAHRRFGFTATPPTDDEGILCMEGMIGPIVAETKYDELIAQEVLAKPRIKIYETPKLDVKAKLAAYRREKGIKGKALGYDVVYDIGIVSNRSRNALIVDKVEELVNDGLTVLVLVERIAQGETLLKMLNVVLPGKFVFVQGQTSSDTRAGEKDLFEKKKRRGVIATRIWTEGVDIKSVGAVVNAAGGLSEIACIQKLGRGFRVTDEKNEIVICDFADVELHPWFLTHSMKRILIYIREGWLK